MAERIVMQPSELTDAAKFLRDRLTDINQQVQLVKSKIDEIESRWEGSAHDAFINQFENDMYPILRDTLPQVLEGISGELDAAANAISQADESIASAFKG